MDSIEGVIIRVIRKYIAETSETSVLCNLLCKLFVANCKPIDEIMAHCANCPGTYVTIFQQCVHYLSGTIKYYLLLMYEYKRFTGKVSQLLMKICNIYK